MIARVLLVDDGRLDNIFHTIVLKKSGVVGEVEAIESAHEALEYLRDPAMPDPDLMIVDLNMPAMRGARFAQLVAQESLSSARIVMLTASSAPEDREEAGAIPTIVDFLTKPLSVEDVQRIDRTWFAAGEPRAGLRHGGHPREG